MPATKFTADDIINLFNNKPLNFCIPRIFEVIEALISAEKGDKTLINDLALNDENKKNYELLKDAFYEFYGFDPQGKTWSNILFLYNSNYSDNLLIKIITFTPVLRLFIKKYAQKIQHHSNYTEIQNDGKYLELTDQQVFDLFTYPLGILSNQSNTTSLIFTNFEENFSKIKQDNVFFNVVAASKRGNKQQTLYMLNCLKHHVNADYVLNQNEVDIYNQLLINPVSVMKIEAFHNAEEREEFTQESKHDKAPFLVQTPEAASMATTNLDAANGTVEEKNSEITTLNTDLQLKQFQIMIGLSVVAAVMLTAAIIFCPPVGIATTIGLAASYAWVTSTASTALGLTAGSYALYSLFNKACKTATDSTPPDQKLTV